MNDATCKTCPWCDHTASQDEAYGRCRVAPPAGIGGGFALVVLAEDWCREHPSLAPKMESVVSSTECVTKDDVKLIVAQAIEVEMRRATHAQRAYSRHTKAT